MDAHAKAATTGDPASQDLRRWRRALLLALIAPIAVLWLHALAMFFGADFRGLGITPRSGAGLIGVLTAPMVHGSWGHVINNAMALSILGALALYAYPRALKRALPLIWILAGLGTWLIGRDSSHIGASGITYGLMFFLGAMGVLRWEPRAIAVAMTVFLLYGGMLFGVLPQDPGVSWEYHLSGALAGVLAALIWRALDPPPARPRWSWEIEAELAERAAAARADELELPRPGSVPVLWQRNDAAPSPEHASRVLPFRRPSGESAAPTPPIDQDPPTDSRH